MTRFERIAIVNRGEAAMRLIVAARELSQGGGRPLTTIALYSQPDRGALFVREADERHAIGPPAAYLDLDRLASALRAVRADAAWVGWGFVAENPAFAELCARLGVTFIGPDAAVMRRLGDKIAAKRAAEAAGVPVAPWSGGPIASLDEALAAGRRIGYPLMVKASAGGGGRGIRRVVAEGELSAALELARAEAQRSFGDPTVFLEAALDGARHVEVQIIGDHHGTVWALGTRDCTAQRRHQKLIEEAPAPLSPAEDRAVRDAAVRLARAAGYHNAGTIELLLDPVARRLSFMEVNARLQVEHPVTEVTTGVDLVKLQLHVAAGGMLEGEPPATTGHAIELRLNAEDPDRGFAPSPGTLERFRMPAGAGVRVDTGYHRGDVVPVEFDSLLAKIIVSGRDRPEALARARRALRDTAVVLRGGATNKGFLLDLLGRPEVERGELDVGSVDRLVAAGEHRSSRGAEVAVIAAALEAYQAATDVDKLAFARSAARGRPSVPATDGVSVELSHRGQTYALRVARLDRDRYRVDVHGRRLEATVEQLAPSELRLSIGARAHRVLSLTHGTTHLVEVDGLPHRVSREGAGVVRALAPSVVVSIHVAPGDRVAAGDRLVVLEAMKSYLEVTAEQAGRVRQVAVLPNTQVGPGSPLVVIDPEDDAATSPPSTRLVLEALVPPPTDGPPAWRRALDDLRSLVLGYDVDGAALRAALAGDDGDGEERRRLEADVLETFADLLSIYRRRPAAAPAGDPHEDVRASASEHLHAYLRDLGGRGAGLPPSFIAKLLRALAHYGVGGLERTPELHEGLFRICKARGRLDEQVPSVAALLARRITAADRPGMVDDPRLATILDRLVEETHGALQEVNDAARELRWRCFEQPLIEASRRRLLDEAAAHLAALEREERPAERRALEAALIATPCPLQSFLSARLPAAGKRLRRAMTEVLLARYHDIPLDDIALTDGPRGLTFATGAHAVNGEQVQVIAAHLELEGLDAGLATAAGLVAAAPAGRDVYLDLYAWSPQPVDGSDAGAAMLADRLGAVAFARRPCGVVVAVTSPESQPRSFTFRPDETGRFVEQRQLRGLHPSTARRLQLWRLARFDLERLASPDEIFLFRAVARDNRSDERLVALAEVRDLTPIRDAGGQVVALPHLERILGESFAAMRVEQARRPPRERLWWNRVQLFLRPPLTLATGEVHTLVRRLTPASDGLGLERIFVRARMPDESGALRDRVIDLYDAGSAEVAMVVRDPPTDAIEPLSRYAQQVVRLRKLGLTHPYEIVAMLTRNLGQAVAGLPPGEFQEHDLAPGGDALVPVARPRGENLANLVVGVIRNFTAKHPEGMARVIVLGDPSRDMGALAEPECRRIIAALALARRLRLPVEWFALSAGARIAMDSGSENMDWISLVLRHIVEHTQAGHEINVVVDGINVGAQPYWNAEATMLAHTRGILVMTRQGAMVLTGKRALDYSGGVSADDNFGIGGYQQVMGPNGQAQYYAADLTAACRVLLRHYEHAYVAPGERWPRRAATADPAEREVLGAPHAAGLGFATVGEIFSDAHNPGRKKPFDIRSVMQATIDADLPPLERWFGLRGGEAAVVWDAHLGGYPVCLLGIESRPLPRLGLVPGDGPDTFTPGTLFPLASKKIARAINAASGNRPVVALANLSGFDGSPESMRELQLEYGAEIGRAVVNFRGPIVFCVISRYHGGAFVVFSARLNDAMEVAALEGSYASVIGGAPAAAVVFAREVDRRARADARVAALEAEVRRAEPAARPGLAARRDELLRAVTAETLGRVAEEFDRVHSVQRAQRVGSVHTIIAPARLRAYLIDAVERGMARAL